MFKLLLKNKEILWYECMNSKKNKMFDNSGEKAGAKYLNQYVNSGKALKC